MAYVPGFTHDIFVSYAHADDTVWIGALLERLGQKLNALVGGEVTFWKDRKNLGESQDFPVEILDRLTASAIFLFFASPLYLKSAFCVKKEVVLAEARIAEKRLQFGPAFKNEQFAIRCLIVPVERDEHYDLVPGCTDIKLCDDIGPLAQDSAAFKEGFDRLLRELSRLLKAMRAEATPVFVYPRIPPDGISDTHTKLVSELTASGYRVVPENAMSKRQMDDLGNASLSVFLIHEVESESEGATVLELSRVAAARDRPWLVWASGAAANSRNATTAYVLKQLASSCKRYLGNAHDHDGLKREVFAALKPTMSAPASSKPQIYLLYNPRNLDGRERAGAIRQTFWHSFDFHEHDVGHHKQRLMTSDGVLLVCGRAEEEWWRPGILEMSMVTPPQTPRGVCLVDRSDRAILDSIAEIEPPVFLHEQIGEELDSQGLTYGFFTPILQRRGEA